MCRTLCEENKTMKMLIKIKEDSLSGRSEMENIRNNTQTHITQLQKSRPTNEQATKQPPQTPN